MEPKYKRILLKLSGEALLGNERNGDPFNPKIIEQYANEIKQLVDLGIEVAIVIGGGNIYRGMNEADSGIERAHGDYMGMLATVINAMAIQAMLEKIGVYTRLQSAINMEQVAEPYIRRKYLRRIINQIQRKRETERGLISWINDCSFRIHIKSKNIS